MSVSRLMLAPGCRAVRFVCSCVYWTSETEKDVFVYTRGGLRRYPDGYQLKFPSVTEAHFEVERGVAPAPATWGGKKRAAKIGRNIKKNTAVHIPEHYIPAFKPAKEFVAEVKKLKEPKPDAGPGEDAD